MTNEEKQILLKDICARLPYGVYCKVSVPNRKIAVKLDQYSTSYLFKMPNGMWHDCKPYLRPMSSMTEEEYEDLSNFSELDCGYNLTKTNFFETEGVWSGSFFLSSLIDWLNEHHFDWRGLIEKGLALEAKEGMYKIE